MLKVMALMVVITLGAPACLVAAEPATPEVRLKQMEEIGSIRSRINFKMDEVRRLHTTTQRANNMRFGLLQELNQKVKNNINIKVSAENAKPLKDQAMLDACTAKVQSMDDTWNKVLSPAYTIFNARYQEQYQVIYGGLSSVAQLTAYDDYVNRADVELQPLVDVLRAIEARVDVAKTKVIEMNVDYVKALEETESVCKE